MSIVYFEIYSVDILDMLGRRYGYDTPMDYIGEDWGTEACKITPREMINMHEMLGWTQEGYRVRIMGPANGALVNKNGITLVQFSF